MQQNSGIGGGTYGAIEVESEVVSERTLSHASRQSSLEMAIENKVVRTLPRRRGQEYEYTAPPK